MDSERVVTDYQRFSESKHFSCFDGLRAFAVLWVLLYHAPRTGFHTVDLWLGAGDLGVDLFFVISGFLITTLILREKPSPLGSRLKRFYIRRSLRIFPLYYLAIFLYWVASARFGQPEVAEVYTEYLPSLLLYYSDYKLALTPHPYPPFGHSWSLAVEEKYYLFWPVIVMVLSERRALQASILCIVVAIALRFGIVNLYDGDVTGRLYYAFDTRFDSIMWGSLLAFLLRQRRAYEMIRRALTPMVLILAVVALNIYGPMASNGSQIRYVVVPILASIILATYLTRPQMLGCRLLNSKPLVYIGQVSYGIYVLHPLAASVVKRLIGGDEGWRVYGIMFGYTLLSIGLAALSFKFFESWFLKFKGRFR